MNITDLLLSALPKKAADGETPNTDVEIDAQFGTFMVETDDSSLPPESDQAADAENAANNLDNNQPDLTLLDKSWSVDPPLNTITDELEPKVAEGISTDKPVSNAAPAPLTITAEPLAKTDPLVSDTGTEELVLRQQVAKAAQPAQSIPLDIPVAQSAAAIAPGPSATLVKQSQPSGGVVDGAGVQHRSEGQFVDDIADTLSQKPVREPLPREGAFAPPIPRENTTPANSDPYARSVNTAAPIASKNSQEQTAATLLFQPLPTEQFQTPEANSLAQFSVASSVAASTTPTSIAQIIHATPQRIINQVSNVITNMSDGNVEIRLDPPELGRVVVSITQTDSGVNAQIMMEKPEMVDFFRRNADIFARELARSGFENATLEFSHKERQQHDPEFENLEELASANESNGGSSVAQTTINVQRGGLDIRL